MKRVKLIALTSMLYLISASQAYAGGWSGWQQWLSGVLGDPVIVLSSGTKKATPAKYIPAFNAVYSYNRGR